jgi:hypothetical protein
MDFAKFPAPYNTELPYYVGLAQERLTLTGATLLEHTLEVAETQEQPGDWFWRAYRDLPQWDKDALANLMQQLEDAFTAKIERGQGELDLMKQVQGIFAQARAVDPDFAARGDDVNLAEAVEVLEGHGISPGISEEVMEMEVEVPKDVQDAH